MQYIFFIVPVKAQEPAAEELNRFLLGQRAVSVTKEPVGGTEQPAWAFFLECREPAERWRGCAGAGAAKADDNAGFISTTMKTNFGRWLSACVLLVATAHAAGEPLKRKGAIDFFATWTSPDYVKVPSGVTYVGPTDDFAAGGRSLFNLSSCAVGYQGWNLIGEWAYSASFFWELNYQQLHGKTRVVYFREVSKYPDLAALYRSIRPQSVSFVTQVILRSAEKIDRSVWLLVTDNDLIYFGSRSGENYVVPGSPNQWKYAISRDPVSDRRFTDQDESSDEEMRKLLAGATHMTVNHAGIKLSIRWPEDAIDMIGELYDLRENEKKAGKISDAGGSSRKQEIAAAAKALEREIAAKAEKKRAQRQREFDRREAELKVPVDVVKENRQFALKRGGKMVASFPSAEFSDLAPLEGTRFFVLTSKEGDLRRSVVDASGAVQTIGEDAKFSWVGRAKDGTLQAEVETEESEKVEGTKNYRLGVVDAARFYRSRGEAEGTVRRAFEAAEEADVRKREQEWSRMSEAERQRQSNSYSYVFPVSYATVGIRRYTLSPDLSVEEKQEGFQIR